MLAVALLGVTLALADPLVKVFPGELPLGSEYVAEVARGEVASWQVCLRPDEAQDNLQVTVSELRGPGGAHLPTPRVRAIGWVPVDKSIPEAPKNRIGTVPGRFPDPLLTTLPTKLDAGVTQSYWIDVQIPENAKPGDYTGYFRATFHGQAQSIPLKATVYPVTVKKSRLWVTNWYSPPPGDPKTDDGFWKTLRTYADDMAAHRQNMAIVSPIAYTDIREDGTFDFSVFNRWVQTFKDAGVIGRIEGGHLGGRIGGGWTNQFEMTILERKDGKTARRNVDPAGPEADAFYAKFFPALVQDLKDQGWLDIYSQHLADEPIQSNVKTYVQMRELARKYAPELKIMEATHTANLAGSMDLWVPQQDYWAKSIDFYHERQSKGEEVWFYTCVYPQGEYANRFMEQPLVETRLLHWMNYKYGATGYLHWGWNRWYANPFEKTTHQQPGGSFLPAGDCFIVYPGPNGTILDSIRWETMRDGIADYELLSMLAEKDKAKADEIASRLIQSWTSYSTDPVAFRRARHDLLAALS